MSKQMSTQKWRSSPATAKPLFPREPPFSWKVLLWILPFFIFVVFSADTSIIYANIVLAALTILAALTLGRHMDTDLLNGQALFLFFYIALGGISCFYALARILALQEFVKLFFSFCMYLLLLMLCGHGKSAGRNAASALSVTAAIFSFLSIDLISTHWFSGLFRTLVSHFTTSYSLSEGIEAGTRITSILEDPNVFAGVAGIGVLLALGLAVTARGKERILHLFCLAISALGFVLVFSLGATGFILIAFLAYLFFIPKESKATALLIMVEVFLPTAVSAFLCYTSVFSGTNSFSLVPMLCVLMDGVVLCLLDRYVGTRLEAKLGLHEKMIVKILIGLIVLAAVYLAAGFHLTGALQLTPGETIKRAEYLSAGDYSASAKFSSDTEVSISSQNAQELVMHTSTQLYNGGAREVSFTVPKNSKVVWFSFEMKSGGTLSSFSYTGRESGSLKLGYKLLPGFIANRLQGLRTNQNAIQRIEFWHDSLQLWEKSPIIGRGLGALEGSLFSVSSFFYQTKYAHNHYIQLLTDLGVVGLALFWGILFFSARMLIRASKKEIHSPLLPCLGAALIFMVLQAIIQVDFSSHSFLPFAFGIFALINVCSNSAEEVIVPLESQHVPLNLKKMQKTSALCYSTMAFSLVWIVLFSAHLIGHSTAVDDSLPVLNRMETAMKIDPFDQFTYKISYLSEAQKSKNSGVTSVATQYAKSLISNPGNFDPNYAVEYFFAKKEYSPAFRALKNHVDFNRVRPGIWKYAFDLLEKEDDGSAEFHAKARVIVSQYETWKTHSLDKIKLSKSNRAYIQKIK